MTPVERPALSGRQKALLSFIEAHVAAFGWAPSIREMCVGIGLNSTSSVAHQLTVLEARGYIRRAERNPRALAVIR